MIKCKYRTRREMFDYIPWGTKSHHDKVKATVYHTFIKEILPYLKIDDLSKHFSKDNGRHTKDLQSMLGLFIIQALKNMTDEEAIEAFCFNDAFKYALDISRDEYLSERAYYYYRAKLLGEEDDIFDSILKTIAERINLNTAIQREVLMSTYMGPVRVHLMEPPHVRLMEPADEHLMRPVNVRLMGPVNVHLMEPVGYTP